MRKNLLKIHSMTTLRGPIDLHVHLSGNGKGGMDCWHRRRWIMRPFLWAGARDIGLECGFGDLRFDELYLNKLLEWASESTLEAAVLLAEDWVRDDHGAVRKDLSDAFVSNNEVFAAVKRSPKLLAGVSIHPARRDALDELERCTAEGAVLLKLLPCVQNVDCNQKKYKSFWTKLAELGLPLLAHTGGEFFVRSCRNDLKSPLCLRLPLECGVIVIAAHCATRALPWDGNHFEEFLRRPFRAFAYHAPKIAGAFTGRTGTAIAWNRLSGGHSDFSFLAKRLDRSR